MDRYLKYYLNKNLINLIIKYVIPNFDELVKIQLPTRIKNTYVINLSLIDIIIKTVQMGYRGFFLDKHKVRFFQYNTELDPNIEMKYDSTNSNYYFGLKNDKRDLFYIDFFQISNIFIYKTIIEKN
jgi:hypothetical protein